MKTISKSIIYVVIYLLSTNSYAQDIITKRDGTDIKAKILEIGASEISYKKFDNQSGPKYISLKSEILMIRYENGTKDIFDHKNTFINENELSKTIKTNNYEVSSNNVKVEILEQKSTKDSTKFIEYSIQVVNGQLGGLNEKKQTKVPAEGYVFVLAKIKVTNYKKLNLKLHPTIDLLAKNKNEYKSKVFLKHNSNGNYTYQTQIYENGYLSSPIVIIKKGQSVNLNILTILPESNSQFFIEYKK